MVRGMYKLVIVSSSSRSIRDLKESPSVPWDDKDGESWVPEDDRENSECQEWGGSSKALCS